jgi:hypothetical protein
MKDNHRSVSMFAILSVLLLAGCGKEVGRVPFAAEDTKAVSMPLRAGDVAFWTDIDVKYEGNAALVYDVQLLQGGSAVAAATCDALGPMSMKVGWVETQFGESGSRRGSGKMAACSVSLAKGGPTLVQTTLRFATRPSRVDLNRADLVVKQ